MKAQARRSMQLQLVWAAALAAAAAWQPAAAEGAAGRGGPLLWATAGERAVAGAGDGCAAVLLDSSWALLTTRCLQGQPPYHLTLVGPGDDQSAWAAAAEGGAWRQRRRVAEVVRHRNEADARAAEFPALALARADRPFALGAALRAAPVLAGALDNPRGPLRCSIEGWEVSKQNGNDGAVDSANFTEPIKTTIGAVLTHEQCRAHSLVEQTSQFCVEVPAERGLREGSPLLCGGALAGMHYTATRYNVTLTHHFHLFTKISELLFWLRAHVPKLQVVSWNSDGALIDVAPPKHAQGAKGPKGAAAGAGAGAAAVAAAALASLLPGIAIALLL